MLACWNDLRLIGHGHGSDHWKMFANHVALLLFFPSIWAGLKLRRPIRRLIGYGMGRLRSVDG